MIGEQALTAPTPADWLAIHLATRHEIDEADADDNAADVEPRRVVSISDLLAADAALLRQLHRSLVGGDVPPPAAAMYLAGWFAGGVAGSVGYALATGGVGFVVEPDAVRWHLHPDGWPERIDLGQPRSVVLATHPWAGQPGVEVVEAPGVVLERAVGSVIAAATPVVDGCRALAKVGRAGLWNEVGDSLGTALTYCVDPPVTPTMLAILDGAVRVPGVPWRARPGLRFADASFGRLHVAQKGGCCLAYTETGPEADYCLTCSFRDPADSDARQVAWMEEQHRERTGTNP